jgi:lipopolysaccharide/colanic/teichoic acid biosynthesis glycosyltransferase
VAAISAVSASPAWPPPAHRGYTFGKRLIDAVIAAVVLVGGAPLWLLIGTVIRMTSPGPALFRGRVHGRDGREFTYYKFRSMRTGDDSHHRDWIESFVREDRPFAHAGGTAVYKVVDDPRITRVGGVLRKTSLDEVPQLINVLRGEMSIVGPRPPVPAEYRLYDDQTRRRLAVIPGITGLYQITARSRVPFSRMVAIDFDYIQRRSVLLDLTIMVRTVAVLVTGRGGG